MAILFANFILSILLGHVVLDAVGVLPDGDAGGMAVMRVFGLGVVLCDLGYRRSRGLTVWSLDASTFFWILPTWVFGLFCLTVGPQLLWS